VRIAPTRKDQTELKDGNLTLVDRVQPIIRESSALGGDSADEEEMPRPIEPQEDAIETAGVFFQSSTDRDETVAAWREDTTGRLLFKDGENASAVSLTQLSAGIDFENYLFNEMGGFVYTGDMDPVTKS
jgi:hypothetical protein